MENVQNKLFYHIQTAAPNRPFWLQGETYEVGKSKNSFYSFYDSYIPNGNEPNTLLREYGNYNRELIYEDVRKSSFPDLPSRHNCFWLIPYNESVLNYWIPQVVGNTSTKFQILILSCTGQAHYVSDLHLAKLGLAFSLIPKEAFEYWSGVDADSEKAQTEVLFIGKVKVLAFVNPYKPQSTLESVRQFYMNQ